MASFPFFLLTGLGATDRADHEENDLNNFELGGEVADLNMDADDGVAFAGEGDNLNVEDNLPHDREVCLSVFVVVEWKCSVFSYCCQSGNSGRVVSCGDIIVSGCTLTSS